MFAAAQTVGNSKSQGTQCDKCLSWAIYQKAGVLVYMVYAHTDKQRLPSKMEIPPRAILAEETRSHHQTLRVAGSQAVASRHALEAAVVHFLH